MAQRVREDIFPLQRTGVMRLRSPQDAVLRSARSRQSKGVGDVRDRFHLQGEGR
jgi:hypothetical protein